MNSDGRSSYGRPLFVDSQHADTDNAIVTTSLERVWHCKKQRGRKKCLCILGLWVERGQGLFGLGAATKVPVTGVIWDFTILACVCSRKAIEAFREAAQADSEFAKAYQGLAELLSEDGQIEDALVHAQQAARLRPEDAESQKILHDLHTARVRIGKP